MEALGFGVLGLGFRLLGFVGLGFWVSKYPVMMENQMWKSKWIMKWKLRIFSGL